MGWYSRYLFPWLCDLALRQPAVTKLRIELLAGLRGRVLEIGAGTGLNLPHYPAGISHLTVVEPNAGMHRRLGRRLSGLSFPVERCEQGGEKLPFADTCFDHVVSTFTLCSISRLHESVHEIYRVLAPGGTLAFLEHGLCPDSAVQKWQRRLNPLQRRLAGGCRLDIDIPSVLAAQPFAARHIETFFLERTPRTHGYLYFGTARK